MGHVRFAVRHRVVSFTVALAAVTYLDRVCIAVLAPQISAELELSRIQMGYIFSAFAVASALFEVPTAWWADRDGARRVLSRIVLWWSVFTVATAFAWNFASLLVIRFLFGAGEAGAWPCVARVFSRWVPLTERGRIQGIFFAGAHLSGGLTPLLVALLAGLLEWRAIFIMFGFIGVMVCLVPGRAARASCCAGGGARSYRGDARAVRWPHRQLDRRVPHAYRGPALPGSLC